MSDMGEMAEIIARHEAQGRPTRGIAGKPSLFVSGGVVRYSNVFMPFVNMRGTKYYNVSVDHEVAIYPPEIAELVKPRKVSIQPNEIVSFDGAGQIAVVEKPGTGLDLRTVWDYAKHHGLSMDHALIGTRIDIACEIVLIAEYRYPGRPTGEKAPKAIARAIRFDLDAVMKNLDRRLGDFFNDEA